MAKILKLPPPIRIGTLISFDVGGTKVTGRVTEDRGPIGVGGRRLYSVCVYSQVVEMPAENLRLEKT